MKTYIKRNLWDFLLCAAASSGLTANVYNGYEMTDPFSAHFLIILAFTAIVQAVLFLFCYSKTTRRVGIGVGLALLAAAIACMQVFHPFLKEQEFSMGIFWMLLLLIAVGVFLLTRLRIGSFILPVAGNFVIAAEVFLQFGLSKSGYIVFLIASVGLIFYGHYKKNVRWERRTQEARYFGQILITSGAAFACALLIFTLILAPMNLPTQELKLIQQLESMEVIHKVGTYAILPELNDDLESSQQATTEETTNQQPKEDQNKEDQKDSGQDNEQNQDQDQDQDQSQTPDQSEDQTDLQGETSAHAITYEHKNYTPLYITLAAVAALIFSILLKKSLRRRFYRRCCRMRKQEAVIAFYEFYYRILQKVKIKKQPHLTLKEYAKNTRKLTEAYIYGDHNFQDMTRIYTKVCYGHANVTEKELKIFKEAYKDIYQNVREEVGRWRYIGLFYRI